MRNILFLIISIFILSSCKTSVETVEIPVEVTKVEKEYVAKTDTLIQYDSIYVDNFTNIIGDTVYKYRTKYKEKLIYNTKTDTICKTDSIEIPVYITKTNTVTENKLNFFQKLFFIFGVIFACLIVFQIIDLILYKKFK